MDSSCPTGLVLVGSRCVAHTSEVCPSPHRFFTFCFFFPRQPYLENVDCPVGFQRSQNGSQCEREALVFPTCPAGWELSDPKLSKFVRYSWLRCGVIWYDRDISCVKYEESAAQCAKDLKLASDGTCQGVTVVTEGVVCPKGLPHGCVIFLISIVWCRVQGCGRSLRAGRFCCSRVSVGLQQQRRHVLLHRNEVCLLHV